MRWGANGNLSRSRSATRWMSLFMSQAAIPIVRMEDRGDVWIIDFDAPGASTANTEVTWVEDEQALYFRSLERKAAAERREPAPRSSELTWFQRLNLPGADGEQAVADMTRGVIRIRMPKRPGGRPSWEPKSALIGAEEVARDHPGLLGPGLNSSA